MDRFSDFRPVVGSSTYTYKEGIPIPGDLGRPVWLNVIYRSKRKLHRFWKFHCCLTYGVGTLQMLGCIPRSPSPALLSTPSGAAGVESDDSKEELRRLRVSARYAKVFRSFSLIEDDRRGLPSSRTVQAIRLNQSSNQNSLIQLLKSSANGKTKKMTSSERKAVDQGLLKSST